MFPGLDGDIPVSKITPKKMFSEQANHELYLAQKIIKIGSRRSEIGGPKVSRSRGGGSPPTDSKNTREIETNFVRQLMYSTDHVMRKGHHV